jgi:hypothetical protein
VVTDINKQWTLLRAGAKNMYQGVSAILGGSQGMELCGIQCPGGLLELQRWPLVSWLVLLYT